MEKGKIIAIDGFSSTGKSTIAKAIARELNFLHVDTGAMYRAVTLYGIQENIISENDKENALQIVNHLDEIQITFRYNESENRNEIYLNGQNVENEIRSISVTNLVSYVAKIPEIRSFLVEQQRQLAWNHNIVMDGRDIGSVVFPQADLKLFITADAQVRAQRRFNEMEDKSKTTLEEVKANLIERDELDSGRENSPLVKCDDAIEIDNSNVSQEELMEKIMRIVQSKI